MYIYFIPVLGGSFQMHALDIDVSQCKRGSVQMHAFDIDVSRCKLVFRGGQYTHVLYYQCSLKIYQDKIKHLHDTLKKMLLNYLQ